MSETIYINNNKLDINPTDIQIVTNRYSDSFDLAREDTAYAFTSTHGYTSVSMTLAFNLNDKAQVRKLVNIYTQMDRFPFVWIKSARLVANITGFSQSVDDYSMYLVETLTLKQNVSIQGVVFLNAELFYFNHIPMAHSWSFVDVKRATKKSKSQEPTATDDLEFISGLRPDESNLFIEMFDVETQRRMSGVVDIFGSGKETALQFATPTWYFEKQDLIRDLNINRQQTGSQFSELDVDIYEMSRFNDTNTDFGAKRQYNASTEDDTVIEKRTAQQIFEAKNPDEAGRRKTISGFIAYMTTTDIANEGLKIQEITVTKRNRIAMNKMAAYSEPFLQYMGKAPSQLDIEMIADSAGLYDDQADHIAKHLSSSTLINALISKLESDTIVNNKLMPFKNFKMKNALIFLSGTKYYAFDKKLYNASSNSQGQEQIILSFVESDLQTLGLKLQAKRVSVEPLFSDFGTMISTLLNIANEYGKSSKSKSLNKLSDSLNKNSQTQQEQDRLAKFAGDGSTKSLNKVRTDVSASKMEVYLKDDPIGSVLMNLNSQLIECLRFGRSVDGDNEYTKIKAKSEYDLGILIKILDSLRDRKGEIYEGSFVKTRAKVQDIDLVNQMKESMLKSAKAYIKDAFYVLMYVAASSKDPILGAEVVALAEKLIKGSNKDIEQISGEAIPDLHLAEGLEYRLYKEVHAQKLSPFFFLDQEVYLTANGIKSAFDIVSPKIDKVTKDANLQDFLKLDEYYKEGLPTTARLTSEHVTEYLPNQAVPNANRVNVQVDVRKAIEEAANNIGLPSWIAMTMAHIESSLIPTAESKSKLYWGLFQLSYDLRATYGTSPDSRRIWHNPIINSRAAMKWYQEDLRNQLRKLAIKLPYGSVTPSWLYYAHQQGPAFLTVLYEYQRTGVVRNQIRATTKKGKRYTVDTRDNLLNQGRNNKTGKARFNSPEQAIDYFESSFYSKAQLYCSLSREEMIAEFYKWLNVKAPASAKDWKAVQKVQDGKATVSNPPVDGKPITLNAPVTTNPPTAEDVKATPKLPAKVESSPLENSSNKTFAGMNTSQIDIFSDADQAQYRALRTGRYFEYGLNLAVPTAKVYIVAGNENDLLNRLYYRKNAMFEVYGIADLRITTSNEDEPTSLAMFSVLNPASAYSDLDSIASHRLKIDPGLLAMRDEYVLQSTRLRLLPGTQIHIRIGYSNDPNELETIFNGEIVEVDGENMLTIVAEGYGREMVAVEHSADSVSRVGGTLNSSTSSIIHEVMRFDEIRHFGARDIIKDSKNPYAKNILRGISVPSNKSATEIAKDALISAGVTVGVGIVTGGSGAVIAGLGVAGGASGAINATRNTKEDSDGNTYNASSDYILPDFWGTASELFTNVYSPSIEFADAKFTWANATFFRLDPNLPTTFFFPTYQNSPWDILSEMQYRHPGTRCQILNYEQRATFFFGIKEQLYYAESPSIELINAVGNKVQAVYNSAFLAEPERFRDLKPVADFHMFTSEHNIIENGLKISTHFGTKATIRYFNDNPDTETFESNDFEYYEMQADDSLLPNQLRSFDINKNGVDHKGTAFRYGQVGLRKEIEKMYTGKIIVVGNPFIKAGDYAYLNDTQRNLKGVIKVRDCIHTYSVEKGYVTEIVPGLYAEESLNTFSYLFTKLGLTYGLLTEHMKTKVLDSFLTANEFTPDIIQAIEIAMVTFKDLKTLNGEFGLEAERVKNNPQTGLGKFFDRNDAAFIGAAYGLSTFLAFKGITTVFSIAAYAKNTLGLQRAARAARGTAAKQLGNVIAGSLRIGGTTVLELGGTMLKAISGRIGMGGFLARTAITAGASTTGLVGLLGTNPLVALAGAAVLLGYLYTSSKIEEITETRQPLKLFPLMHNGAPYVAGIRGFKTEQWVENKMEEFLKTLSATGEILDFAENVANSASGTRRGVLGLNRAVLESAVEAQANSIKKAYENQRGLNGAQ